MQEIKKKNTQFSILEVANFQVDNIKDSVLKFSSEWLLDQSRQKIYKTHKNTSMYQLRKSSYDWNMGDELIWEDVNIFISQSAQNELINIYNRLETLYNGKVIRSELIKMYPNTSIARHVDGGQSLYTGRRIHIPIITNSNVFFSVLDTRINMLEGVAYEINNGMPHSVENNSNLERVHLIIDIWPNLTK